MQCCSVLALGEAMGVFVCLSIRRPKEVKSPGTSGNHARVILTPAVWLRHMTAADPALVIVLMVVDPSWCGTSRIPTATFSFVKLFIIDVSNSMNCKITWFLAVGAPLSVFFVLLCCFCFRNVQRFPSPFSTSCRLTGKWKKVAPRYYASYKQDKWFTHQMYKIYRINLHNKQMDTSIQNVPLSCTIQGRVQEVCL